MAVEVFANVPTTTVSSGGTDAPASGTQQTWTVTSSALFPAVSSSATPPTQIHIADVALNSEIIQVINISGTTWTVVRGAESTTPVAHTAGFTIYQVVSAGAYAQLRSTDWLNVVTMFGADNTGVADSTTPIQNAVNAAPDGRAVYLPAGTYKTTSPLTLTPGTVLIGDSGWDAFTFGDCGTVIKPSSGFSGTEVLYLPDVASAATQGMVLRDFGIDGSSLPGTTDGIRAFGPVIKTVIQNIAITGCTGWGINCVQDSGVSSGNTYPYDWEVSHVRIHQCAGGGASLPDHTDSTWIDVYVLGCGGTSGHGFQFTVAPGNSHFIGCRAEWTGTGDGWHLTGAWGNNGTFMMTACSTDRNQKNGFYCDATGSFTPVMLANCRFNRDGRNSGSGGGSYAGVQLTSATVPVIFDNVVVTPGVDDDGSGTNSPQIGLIATGSTYISVASGWLWGASTAISNGGSNTAFRVGPNVMLTTGTTASPSYDYDNSWGTDSGSDWTLGGGGRLYLGSATAPACAAGAAAGGTPPAPVVTKATDAAGIITFGTGTSPGAGDMVDVTFHRAYGTEPFIVLCPMNAATAALLPYLTSPASAGFSISFQSAPAASQANTTYAVSWLIMG